MAEEKSSSEPARLIPDSILAEWDAVRAHDISRHNHSNRIAQDWDAAETFFFGKENSAMLDKAKRDSVTHCMLVIAHHKSLRDDVCDSVCAKLRTLPETALGEGMYFKNAYAECLYYLYEPHTEAFIRHFVGTRWWGATETVVDLLTDIARETLRGAANYQDRNNPDYTFMQTLNRNLRQAINKNNIEARRLRLGMDHSSLNAPMRAGHDADGESLGAMIPDADITAREVIDYLEHLESLHDKLRGRLTKGQKEVFDVCYRVYLHGEEQTTDEMAASIGISRANFSVFQSAIRSEMTKDQRFDDEDCRMLGAILGRNRTQRRKGRE